MAGKSSKKKRKTKKIIVIILIIVAVVLAVGYYFINWYLKSKLDQVERTEISVSANDDFPDTGYTTLALFGIDNRSTGTFETGNSDCIMVLSIDNATKECRLASVYRDTYLNVGDDSYRKCNNAYARGGPAGAITMLNKNLDLNIQDYITIDFTGLVDVIDYLGGIEVDVTEKEAIAMQKYIQETASLTGKEGHSVSAGKQTLDGVQACTYARIRKGAGDDYSRTERQRLVIEKMIKKIKKANYATLLNIFNSMVDDMATSMTSDEMLSYIKVASKFEIEDTTGFPFYKTSDTVATAGSIVIPVDLDNNVEKLHEFLYPDEEGYSVSSVVQSYSQQIINNIGQYTADNPPEEESTSDTDSASDSDATSQN